MFGETLAWYVQSYDGSVATAIKGCELSSNAPVHVDSRCSYLKAVERACTTCIG